MADVVTYERVMSDLNKKDKRYNEIHESKVTEQDILDFRTDGFDKSLQKDDIIIDWWYNNGALATGSYQFLIRDNILIEMKRGDLCS